MRHRRCPVGPMTPRTTKTARQGTCGAFTDYSSIACIDHKALFGEPRNRWAACYYKPLVRRTSAPCAISLACAKVLYWIDEFHFVNTCGEIPFWPTFFKYFTTFRRSIHSHCLSALRFQDELLHNIWKMLVMLRRQEKYSFRQTFINASAVRTKTLRVILCRCLSGIVILLYMRVRFKHASSLFVTPRLLFLALLIGGPQTMCLWRKKRQKRNELCTCGRPRGIVRASLQSRKALSQEICISFRCRKKPRTFSNQKSTSKSKPENGVIHVRGYI